VPAFPIPEGLPHHPQISRDQTLVWSAIPDCPGGSTGTSRPFASLRANGAPLRGGSLRWTTWAIRSAEAEHGHLTTLQQIATGLEWHRQSLTLERRLADRFMPVLRREVFDALATAPRNRVSLEGGFLTIDLREPRRELAASVRKLRRVRALVISDPDILGGDPVFRDTRPKGAGCGWLSGIFTQASRRPA
jgi:hypothetical protein